MKRFAFGMILALGTLPVSAEGWTAREEVLRGTERVAAYRARIAGDILLVEATHGEQWHTYAMDNPERAVAAGGNLDLGLELPTRIEVSGGAQVVGRWRQSRPLDLSDPEIGWYTWGFADTAYFAVRLDRVPDKAITVTINAQACSDSACRMIDRVILVVDAGGSQPDGVLPIDFEELVPVKTHTATD